MMGRWFNALFILSMIACDSHEQKQMFQLELEEKNPWSNKPASKNSASFRFAIVSDRTAIPTPGVFNSAIKKLNHLQPDFVMSIGDLVQGYTYDGRITDMDQIDQEWDYVSNLIDDLQMPFFYTVGNNDINSSRSLPLWTKRFGRTYYHFIYQNTLFLVVNTDDPPGSQEGALSADQLRWLTETVQIHSDVRWTFIFMHRPIWSVDSLHEKWKALKNALINKGRTSIFAGHITRYSKTMVNEIQCYTLAKTGSFSPGSPPPADDFDHIMWVTMTENGPVLANLLLDGIWGDDPITEAKND